MKPIDQSDVRRFSRGEVSRRSEERNIIDAIAKDPQLAEYFEQLQAEAGLFDTPAPRAAPEWLTDLPRNLKQAVLWNLVLDQHPCGLMAGQDIVTGNVRRLVQGDLIHEMPVTIRRASGDGHEFVAEIGGRPSEYRPLGIVLSRFRYALLGRWNDEFDWAGLPEVRRRGAQRDAAAASASYSLKASELRRPSPDRLSALAELDCSFDARTSVLDVTARLPPDHEGAFAVAEARRVDAEDNDIVTRRLVHLNQRDEQRRWHGAVSFRGSSGSADGKLRLSVREMTDDDLYLLAGSSRGPLNLVTLFLASQQYLSMPITETGGAFRFRALRSDQQEMASDEQSSWTLLVSGGKEA